MGVMDDGRAMISGSRMGRAGIGSGIVDENPSSRSSKHKELKQMLQMASSTSVPVSGVALTAKTG